MDYNEAQLRHRCQWNNKFNVEYVFPYNVRYQDDTFVEVVVYINNCMLQEVDDGLVDKYMKYIKEGVNLGPSWVLYGKRLSNGTVNPFWHNKLLVVDGNHRMAGKLKMGDTQATVIMPTTNYKFYMRQYNE